jgi:hypothetical protein
MESITYNSSPVRLSEQEGVDCVTMAYGCGGGWMEYYWDFSSSQGSTTNAAYPYQGTDNSCRNQANKYVASRAGSHGQVTGTTMDMMEQL